MFHDSEYVVFGGIMLMLTLIGLIINILAVYLASKLPSFQNAYGIHVISTLSASIGVMCCFLFWSIPTTILQYNTHEGKYFYVPGQIEVFFFYSGMYTHICTCINRLAAIYKPQTYSTVFTRKRTIVAVGCMWILSAIQSFIYSMDGCAFYYIPSEYVWSYEDTECGRTLSFYLDLWYNVIFACVIFILNLMALWKLYTSRSNVLIGSQKKRLRAQETSFFLQSFVITLLIILVNVFFNVVSRYCNGRVCLYLVTTTFWQCYLIAEGLVPFIFNREFRQISEWPICGRLVRTSKYNLKDGQKNDTRKELPADVILYNAYLSSK